MKTVSFLIALWVLPFAGASAQDQPSAARTYRTLPKNLAPPVAGGVTDEQLIRLREQQNLKIAAGPQRETWDIEKNSEFIAYDKTVTLVPKGAILHTPERFRPNIVSGLDGSFLTWSEFIAKYRGLITPFEVTLEQATGEKPLDAARFDAAKKSGLIVVAVLNRSPISVLSAPTATSR